MRIEDQYTQLRVRRDRLVQEQRHGRRLADTGRADDGEMLGEHRRDMDRRIDAFVLGQLADDGGRALAGIVNAHQVGGSDAVRDGAEIGITRDAGREFLAPVLVDTDFAEQLGLDPERIVFAFAPGMAAGVHLIDERDDAVAADADRNQPAHGPQFGEIGAALFGDGGNRRPRTAACNDAAEKAISRRMAIAAIMLACRARRAQVVVEQRATPCGSVEE